VALKQFLNVFPNALASFFFNRGLPIGEVEHMAVSCVHDIALEIAKSKYRCRGKGSFAGWVFTIAHNRLVDWQRHPRPEALPEELSIPEAAPEDEADFGRIMAVTEALTKLSALDQEIIQLRYFGALHSFEEIGALLNISTGNVRLRHFRALKTLREILEKDTRLARKHAKPFEEVELK
jgi:RNA polymerase sigma factor (sigma-70 family)